MSLHHTLGLGQPLTSPSGAGVPTPCLSGKLSKRKCQSRGKKAEPSKSPEHHFWLDARVSLYILLSGKKKIVSVILPSGLVFRKTRSGR